MSPANFDRVDALEAFAATGGHGLHDLAMSWLAAQPVIASVIAGVSKADQVAVNAEAAVWALTPDDFAAIDEIVPPPTPVSSKD